MRAHFLGVRGSCPCPTPGNGRYGANTASVRLEADPAFPILFDLGTGVARYAATTPTCTVSALVSHLHFDHVQGLPFLGLAHTPGARLDVYAPRPGPVGLRDAMAALIRPPYFPLPLADFQSTIEFHEVGHDRFDLGEASITVRPVPHVGPSVGYRVEHQGTTVAYVSDHQAPRRLDTVADSVLELAAGADLLIHDAQYTDQEFATKADWGHCTVAYAVLVARTAGARRLCLFHHDPSHDDDEVDRILAHARALAVGPGPGPNLDVIAAYEGLDLPI